MKLVAVSMFVDEISPRFDCCSELAFVDSERGFDAAEMTVCGGPDGEKRLEMIALKHAETLLCGGIRRCDWLTLRSRGVEVISGLHGRAGDLFEQYVAGVLRPGELGNPLQFQRERRRKRMKGGRNAGF